jgi:hypothetical protein
MVVGAVIVEYHMGCTGKLTLELLGTSGNFKNKIVMPARQYK